jgi:hypothetical protein
MAMKMSVQEVRTKGGWLFKTLGNPRSQIAKQLEEFQGQGWEVVSITDGAGVGFFTRILRTLVFVCTIFAYKKETFGIVVLRKPQ